MKISEMKEIAAGRAKGDWKRVPGGLFGYGIQITKAYARGDGDLAIVSEEDLDFIAMAANNFDKIMAVVEAALSELNWFDLSAEQQERQHKPLFDVLKGLDGE